MWCADARRGAAERQCGGVGTAGARGGDGREKDGARIDRLVRDLQISNRFETYFPEALLASSTLATLRAVIPLTSLFAIGSAAKHVPGGFAELFTKLQKLCATSASGGTALEFSVGQVDMAQLYVEALALQRPNERARAAARAAAGARDGRGAGTPLTPAPRGRGGRGAADHRGARRASASQGRPVDWRSGPWLEGLRHSRGNKLADAEAGTSA